MAKRDDTQALAELERRPLGLPAGLDLEWLGVSGYRISYEGRTLFIDPYLSRVPLRDLVLRRQALPSPAALDRFGGASGEVVGVLVGHTHFDHAVDAPAIARRFGCRAYGSSSHSLSPGAYRCGQVWGISIKVAEVRFYHQGSANLIDDAVRERGVDVFLAGVAGRSFTRDYWRRILPRLDPRVVVPTHYDNFFRPLGRPLEFVSNAQLSKLPAEIGSVSREIELAALPRSDA